MGQCCHAFSIITTILQLISPIICLRLFVPFTVKVLAKLLQIYVYLYVLQKAVKIVRIPAPLNAATKANISNTITRTSMPPPGVEHTMGTSKVSIYILRG